MALLAVAVVLNLSHFSLATPVVARDIYASRTVPHRSCETLINHCVDTSTPSEIKQTWSIHSCVAAAACYGAEAVVDILCTRTTVCPRLRDEVRIPSDMYTSIVPACAAIGPGCYMSQDSYREFHYATLHSINAGEIPTGAEVDAIWDSLAFSATSCGFNCQNPRLSYKEFNQWFQIPEPVGVLTPAEPPGKRSTPTTTHVRPKSSSKTSITLNTASESMKSFKVVSSIHFVSPSSRPEAIRTLPSTSHQSGASLIRSSSSLSISASSVRSVSRTLPTTRRLPATHTSNPHTAHPTSSNPSRSRVSVTSKPTHDSRTGSPPVASPSRSDSASRASVTSISFNSNPAPPLGATSETFIAPGITTAIPVPTVTTVITLGPVSVANVTLRFSTVTSGSRGESTIVQTVQSSVSTRAAITLGPGGVVIGSIPTSVSQPGAVIPIFNTNPTPPPGATELTFTGMGGFSTVVPIPTASHTIIAIGGSSGGGSIQLGPGGTIIGTLPLGVVEVGGLTPIPLAGPGTPAEHPELSSSLSNPAPSSSTTSATSSSASAAASCAAVAAPMCGTFCDAETNTTPGIPSIRSYGRRTLLESRKVRQMGTKCSGGPTVSPSGNAPGLYEKSSVPHQAFGLTSYGGISLDIVKTSPVKKPREKDGSIADFETEHIFEFQMFAEFVYRVLQDQRNSDLQGCSGNWIKGFYDPVGNPQIKEIVNRIDNIKNLVFADTFINGAKKYSVAHKYKQVGEKGLDTWTPESRQETVNGIRALAVFPTYMNDNAAAFRSTVGDIIAILQKYDRRMGSLQSPPLAVQFHQRVQSELTWYGSHAQSLATNLATKFAAKLAKYPALTCYSNFATLESDLNNNFPTLNTAALLPPAPLCFPDGSRGRLDFRPPPYSPGLGIVLGSLTIGSATANGNNIQVDITRPSGALMYPSVFPPSEPVAECVGIYHILPVISPPAPKIQLDFDCNTRELSIQGLANPRCVLFKIITTLPTTMQTQTSYEQLCGTSLQDTVACGVKFFPGSNVMEDNKMFWEAVPG